MSPARDSREGTPQFKVGNNSTKAATASGRPLTEQEALVAGSAKNKAPASSVNHVIASGTGQNVVAEAEQEVLASAALT